jgi:hypothetical protein
MSVFIPIVFFRLPCNCIIEYAQVNDIISSVSGRLIVECPWCGASFLNEDVEQFVDRSPRPIITPQRLLATDGKCLYDVVGTCSEGHFMVRERRREATVEHHEGELQFLKD